MHTELPGGTMHIHNLPADLGAHLILPSAESEQMPLVVRVSVIRRLGVEDFLHLWAEKGHCTNAVWRKGETRTYFGEGWGGFLGMSGSTRQSG